MRAAETTVEAAANNVNVDHTNAATMSEAAVVTAGAAANQATIDGQHAAADAAEIGGSEIFAHGQNNPMYATLIAQIAARFRPLAPTGLAAAAVAGGTASVNLTWAHNACNETEYRVYRRRRGGAFTKIATLPAGSVSFTDALAGMAAGTDFTYFVTAAGVAGESAHSNQAAVHTPSPPTLGIVSMMVGTYVGQHDLSLGAQASGMVLMSRAQDEGRSAAQGQTTRLERARAAARAFCRHFKFQEAAINQIDGDPIQPPLIFERSGSPVEVFRWLGHGRGASYVQVELSTETKDITVYGAVQDREFGPWKP